MKFQETKTGQMLATIPKHIVAFLKLVKGEDYSPYVNERGNIELSLHRNSSINNKHRRSEENE